MKLLKKALQGGFCRLFRLCDQFWNQTALKANNKLNKERTTLLKEYRELKPLMNEYKFFYGKEKEMHEAEVNLEVYKRNGYADRNWNVFQRTAYFLTRYEEDKVNVKLYKELNNKIFRTVLIKIDLIITQHAIFGN